MQASSVAIRWRMFFARRSNLPTMLLGAVLLLLMVVVLLSKTPSEHSYEVLSNEEAHALENDELQQLFPGKCTIKNFDVLRRMSIVYTWVNGSQPCYRDLRQKHGGANAVGGSRDREIGELKFSIRSLRKFLPWHIGQIYIVSPGHIPSWLDMNNPRIKVINQDDLFPDYAKQFLPTFNTHVIEQFLYLIPGLSDIYMQINDDYLFTKPIAPHEFFTCDGGIRLLHESGLISHKPPTAKKGIWIASVLNTQQEMDLRWGQQDRYFIKHAPFIYSRRAFERIHQIFDRPLYMTLKSKFRNKPDMNMPLLHHYYMTSQGSKELGIPVQVPPEEEMNVYKLILMKNDNQDELKQLFADIISGYTEYRIVALNDEYNDMAVADLANNFFQTFLPVPSEYELPVEAPDDKRPLTVYKPGSCQLDDTILAPFLKRVETSQTFQVIAHRQTRWVAFVNSLLKGLAFGLGLLIVRLFYVLIASAPVLSKHSGPSAYDKV